MQFRALRSYSFRLRHVRSSFLCLWLNSAYLGESPVNGDFMVASADDDGGGRGGDAGAAGAAAFSVVVVMEMASCL